MASSEAHNFLSLEDLRTSSTSPPPSLEGSVPPQTPPEKVVIHSKPAKKRKSWGQELPEPKTALPPRKRAKTDDEKEQRRIERIKRNRAAAHNSRERKRQETETLAVALARANAKLAAYEKLHGPLPKHIVLPEVTLSTDSAATPAPSLVESHGSAENSASPMSSPHDTLLDVDVHIKEEPTEPAFSALLPPPAFDNLDLKSMPSHLDRTQHSAAMLCDLQCQSSSPRRSIINTQTSASRWWATLFLHLMTLQFQTSYRSLLLALWTLSPSRMARLMQASTLRSTSRSTTSFTATTTSSQLSQSRPAALAQHSDAATGRLVSRQRAQQALLRQWRSSVSEMQRTRSSAAATAKQQHQNATDTLALREQNGPSGFGSEGEDSTGVGR